MTKIPIKYVRTDLKVRFELADIILTTGHIGSYKSVMLMGARFWNIAHLQKVAQMYFDKGIL